MINMKPDERMLEWAKYYLNSKTEFEKQDRRYKAYQAGVGLSGLAAKSGIKREMEKLRLIKIFRDEIGD